ncbi:tRNA lysidine(34) synthetase TilS [Bacteroides graminisolvens]|uniref:tRNA lysidine(34) synthetase TilS n=1 Tax=Bacteroides graminisolvens TaxID=477666 RepID=UPI0023F0CAD3|nr:tRNA lysidine(34) synthetase TilS [Bacteroides graminisolvens]MDD3210835.1 tRNA lysidine(34) synthetase TilS [Bacteroides graminisolvens]
MLVKKVKEFIEKEDLFSKQDKILVALSGGADSVALTRILITLDYHCEAAHCNFELRGEESDRDEDFVRNFCRSLNIKCHSIHFETRRYAAQQSISIEMAARELRYNWFSKICEESDCQVVAVAHHKDDSVETMLLNLIRGTGINGLLGIRPKNGNVVRPLLCASRQEVVAYLHRMNQTYVTDSTNLEDEYTRNKIRLNLLPLMEEINPSVKDGLVKTASYLNDISKVYQQAIKESVDRIFITPEKEISIEKLMNEPAPQALLFEVLSPLGFNSTQVEEVYGSLNGQPGKRFISSQWQVVKDRELLLIEKVKTANDKPQIIFEEVLFTKEFVIPKDKNTACFDANKFKGVISIRKWEKGDYFIPFGMKGKKLVSDFMTDSKFSLLKKEQQWVLSCNDQIAWLIGERTDNRFRIDDSTQKVIIAKLGKQE